MEIWEQMEQDQKDKTQRVTLTENEVFEINRSLLFIKESHQGLKTEIEITQFEGQPIGFIIKLNNESLISLGNSGPSK